MTKILNIAVDAMGGEGSPKKAIDGIMHHSKSTKNINYNIFGDEKEIKELLKDLRNNSYKIFDTKDKILDTDSPLTAARKGKNSSMWKAIESVKIQRVGYNNFCRKYRGTLRYCKNEFRNDRKY